MSQVLRDGKDAACQSAVARITPYLARYGIQVPDSNTDNYCKAHATSSEVALHDPCCDVASTTDDNADSDWFWKNKPTYFIDGVTRHMPDTIKDQCTVPFVGGTKYALWP